MNDSPVDCQSRGKALPTGKEVLLPLPKKERSSRFVLFLSNPKDWYVINALRALHVIRRFATAWHARARSPFARWHSVLRSVFDGTLAEQSARASLVQARTHSRLIITRQCVSLLRIDAIHHFVMIPSSPFG